MKKLLSLCTPLFETADFHKLVRSQNEYLNGVYKSYIEDTNPLYNKILSLVQKPIDNIPSDFQPTIKLLKYNEGAVANLHLDDCDYGTSIILIESSKDLQGGETCIRTNKFEIISMQPGDHVFHPKGRWHGVTEITKGYRKVLVLVW